jgi:hypothetical protein
LSHRNHQSQSLPHCPAQIEFDDDSEDYRRQMGTPKPSTQTETQRHSSGSDGHYSAKSDRSFSRSILSAIKQGQIPTDMYLLRGRIPRQEKKTT